MRILCVADIPSSAFWDGMAEERLREADLIISCGDLPAPYLEFLVTMASCPLLYVHGNHDSAYERKPPEGCICIDGRVYMYGGLRFVGLGGSARYKPGPYMYTEKEMKRRIRRLCFPRQRMKGVDILVTHAPPRGYGDLEDMPHQGFQCFNDLLLRYRPSYLLHGHIHKSYGGFVRRQMHESGTTVINCSEYYELDVAARDRAADYEQHF